MTTVTSVLALVRQVHRAETGGATLALPDDERTLRDELDLLDGSGHELVASLRRAGVPGAPAVASGSTPSGRPSRRRSSTRSSPTAAGSSGRSYVLVPTGELYRVVHDSTGLVHQQVTSFGTAIVLVVLAIGLLFRSVTFTVLALIPNVLPILWTGGLMGFTGIELSDRHGDDRVGGPRPRRRRHDLLPVALPARRAAATRSPRSTRRARRRRADHRGVGEPHRSASGSARSASFKPTIYFSLLTGLTMITGVVCDLLVLPASLIVAERWTRDRRA